MIFEYKLKLIYFYSNQRNLHLRYCMISKYNLIDFNLIQSPHEDNNNSGSGAKGYKFSKFQIRSFMFLHCFNFLEI